MEGAALSLNSQIPSVNLSQLVKLITATLSESPDKCFDFKFDENNHILDIGLESFLFALSKRAEFKRFLDDTENGFISGFNKLTGKIKNKKVHKIGGYIKAGTEKSFSDNVEKLYMLISSELSRILDDNKINSLLAENSKTAIFNLAKQMGFDDRFANSSINRGDCAALVPIKFVDADEIKSEEFVKNSLARVFTVIEKVKDGNIYGNIVNGIKKKLRLEEFQEDIIESIVESIEMKKNKPDNEVDELLNFLSGDALSRVRLRITFKLMEILSYQKNISKNLECYINNVRLFFEFLTDNRKNCDDIDISRDFGVNFTFSLKDYADSVSFYKALPVWADWVVQLSELRYGDVTEREITYRFKLNGKNIYTGKSSFESRLETIEKNLDQNMNLSDNIHSNSTNNSTLFSNFYLKNTRIIKNLSSLILLYLVIPSNNLKCDPAQQTINIDDFEKVLYDLIRRLKDTPQKTIKFMIDSLKKSHEDKIVDDLAFEISSILKNKKMLGENLSSAINNFYLKLDADIIDIDSIDEGQVFKNSCRQNSFKDDRNYQNWFRHIDIIDKSGNIDINRLNDNSILTIEIEAAIKEKILHKSTEEPLNFKIERNLNDKVLVISFIPEENYKNWRISGKNNITLLNPGINFRYKIDLNMLYSKTLTETENTPPDSFFIGNYSALSIIVYLISYYIINRIKCLDNGTESKNVKVHILRLQSYDDYSNRDEKFYAMCHAVELILSNELLVKMQGYNLNERQNDNSVMWRKRSAFVAFQGGFPIIITKKDKNCAVYNNNSERSKNINMIRQTDGNLDLANNANLHMEAKNSFIQNNDDKSAHCHNNDYQYINSIKNNTALISYITRPVNTYSGNKSDMLIVKTYKLNTDMADELSIFLDKTDVNLIDNDFFEHPKYIIREIARLKNENYNHIILLSHQFERHHILRDSSEYNYLNSTFDYIKNIDINDVFIYPLRKDVFSATRFRKRDNENESGFEISSFSENYKMYDSRRMSSSLYKTSLPIYTFATLSIYDEAYYPQSGFCTYFFDSEAKFSDEILYEKIRANILGITGDKNVYNSIIFLLRGVHFIEREKISSKKQFLPKLNPFAFTNINYIGDAGETNLYLNRNKTRAVFSFSAALTNVKNVLHKLPIGIGNVSSK